MFSRILLAVSLMLPTFAFADDYGACNGEARMLLSQGGAIAKMTGITQDRTKFDMVFTHEFGTVQTGYHIDWEKFTTPEARAKATADTLAEMDEDVNAIKDGRAWYLVVNRAVFKNEGLPPLFKDMSDPSRTTKWRPYYMFASTKGDCSWMSIEWAVFEDELPEGIRKQLK